MVAFLALLYFSPETREKIFKKKEEEATERILPRAGGNIGLNDRNSPIYSKDVYDNYMDRAEHNETLTPQPTRHRHKRKLSDEIVLTEKDHSNLIEKESRNGRRPSERSFSSTTSSSHFDNPVYAMAEGGYENQILDSIITREHGKARRRSKDRSITPGGPISEFRSKESRNGRRSRDEHRPRSRRDDNRPTSRRDDNRPTSRRDDNRPTSRREENRPRSRRNDPRYGTMDSVSSLVLDGRKLKHFADFGEYDENEGSLV